MGDFYVELVKKHMDTDEIDLTDSGFDSIEEVFEYVAGEVINFYEHCKEIMDYDRPAKIDYEDGTSRNWFVGSITTWAPSKKYYAFWTSNQTLLDEVMDATFWDCIEELLPNVSFESGEGDGCDIFMSTWESAGSDNE